MGLQSFEQQGKRGARDMPVRGLVSPVALQGGILLFGEIESVKAQIFC